MSSASTTAATPNGPMSGFFMMSSAAVPRR
jgi:hypothetical protein